MQSQIAHWKFCATQALSSDFHSYNIRAQRLRDKQWVFGLAATIISGFMYRYIFMPAILNSLNLAARWANLPAAVLPTLAGVIGFIGATFIALLMNQAVTRYNAVSKAYGEIKGAVQGIILNLNEVEDPDLRDKLFRTLRRILRAMCAQACREKFTTIVTGPAREKEFRRNTLMPLLEVFRQLLSKAGIVLTVIGNNGRIHILLTSGAAIELVVAVPLPLSLYLATGAMLFVLYLVFTAYIVLFGGMAAATLGTVFTALLGGAAALVIFVARNREDPFGSRKSDLRPRTFFLGLEDEIDDAIDTRAITLPQQELPAAA